MSLHSFCNSYRCLCECTFIVNVIVILFAMTLYIAFVVIVIVIGVNRPFELLLIILLFANKPLGHHYSYFLFLPMSFDSYRYYPL